MKRSTRDLLWQEVTWRRQFSIEAVYELLTHLATLSPRSAIIWETRGQGGHVRYLLGADRRHMEKIKQTFLAHGDIQFYPAPNHIRSAIGTARQLKISRPQLSLSTNVTMAVVRAGLAAMAMKHGSEETVLQLVIGSAFSPMPPPRNISDPHASWLQVIMGAVAPASTESLNSIKEKMRQHRFNVLIRMGASGESSAANSRIMATLSALKTLESAGVHLRTVPESTARLNAAQVPWHFSLRMSVKELASFLLLPVGEEELPGTMGLHPKSLPPPAWYKSPTNSLHDRTFATSEQAGQRQRLSISPRDSLEHTIILGPTGSGKSTLMQRLILADIKAGRGVLVIDPKADLVRDILSRIPKERDDDVVVIDPSDHHSVGFNPLNVRDNSDANLAADAILAVFKEIFADNWGIRSQDILSAALLTLAYTKDANMLWLVPLLTDDAFRAKITAKLTDEIALKPFWSAFNNLKYGERSQETAPVMNKLRQFFLRPGLRNVLGQSQPKFSLSDLFDKRRIVLVSLNKGIIGSESARLLGSLMVGLTWTLALSRAKLPPERRHIVSMYIDELQDYLALPTDLPDALTQARGLGVGLTLAHQYRGQLSPAVRSAIDANARNKIVFGLSSSDAKDMAAMAPGLDALDFMTLPRYKVYTSFQSDGKSTGWVSGQTEPPVSASRLAAELKAKSMEMYGKSAAEVEASYLKLLETTDDDEPEHVSGPVGRRKRT